MSRQSEFVTFKNHLKEFVQEAQAYLDKNEAKYEKFQLTQVPTGYVCKDKYLLGEKAFEYRENFNTLTKHQKDALRAMDFALKSPSDDINIISFIPFVKYNLNKQKQQKQVVETVYKRKNKTKIFSSESNLNKETKNEEQDDIENFVDLFLFSEKTNQKQLKAAVLIILKRLKICPENNYIIEKNNEQLVLKLRKQHLARFLVTFPIAINSYDSQFGNIRIEKTLCYPLELSPDTFICGYLKADVFKKISKDIFLYELTKLGEQELINLLQSPIREQKTDFKTSLNLSFGRKNVLIDKKAYIPLCVSLNSSEKCDRISNSIKTKWAKREYETALAKRFKATQNIARDTLLKHNLDPENYLLIPTNLLASNVTAKSGKITSVCPQKEREMK